MQAELVTALRDGSKISARTPESYRASGASTPISARRPRAEFWLNGVAWWGLCVVAVGYLISLAPASFYSDFPPSADHATASQDNEDRRDRLAVDVADLGARMMRMQAVLKALEEQSARMESRLTKLNDTLGSVTSAVPAAGRTAGAVEKSASGLEPVTVAYRPMPADGFGDSDLDASPVPIAALAAPNRISFAVELAQGGDDSDFDASWRGLRAVHAPLLDALEARVAEDESGQRLLAGPFRNAADAARLCARLKSAEAHCRETVFDGEPL